ncbi:hypothetical protein [Paraflavitalea sp. CAU 1676]|uniref:hypothetical protein n=1 Tax=Paraflavitalea sp. CAU 1676 TaxID=3032598 RepID=UPI0023DAD9CC|nr:hypothetical protein [Paraflavitalea sp. CAU 1676]MDF2193087.1 hypothetical protein [Paraflavitalea sp. CAU 1676]
MEASIYEFFAAYEKRFNDALKGETDVEGTAAAFAPFFVEASPAGIHGGSNDQEFRKKIPQGMDFYRQIGTYSMEILSQDVTELDDLHYMVKVHWKAAYKNKDNTDLAIEFDVIYFLQTRDDEWKVFAYITGDEDKVMREHGLIQ